MITGQGEFIFDGINSRTDLDIVTAQISKPISPEITNSSQPVPARYGVINLGNSYGAKTVNITITVMANTREELAEKSHNLANAFIRPNDEGAVYSMIFPDEPDVEYYGIFTEIPELTPVQKGVWDSTTTLKFYMPDPRGYMPQQTVQVTDEPFEFTPAGTGETAPVYRLTLHKDVNEIGMALASNDDNYVDIGMDQSVDDDGNVADNEPLMVSDPCNTLAQTSWVAAKTAPFDISGTIAGTFMSNTESISVKRNPNNSTAMYDYGDVSYKGWTGPMIIHQALTNTLSDMDHVFRMHHEKNYFRGMSKAEAYWMDGDSKCVARFYIQDGAQGNATKLYVYFGPSGHEVKVYAGTLNLKNGKNKKDTVTVIKKGTKVTYTGKGKKKKKKTTTIYYPKKIEITDYENTDYYNKCLLQFHTRKIGRRIVLSINKCDIKTGKTGAYIMKNKVINLPAASDFNYSTLAFRAAKHNITEDSTNPKTNKPNKLYNYGFNAITSYAVHAINNGGNTEAVPQIIAHKDDQVIIDCETNQATLISGANVTSLNKYVAWGSNFPSLQGGQTERIGFSPSGDDADIEFDYRPTYR
ncbi:phage tail family protein [Pediococcus inopinatus]|uniref:Phage tail family protein n=1 Tax=Pediococcus inopinatus TaxID=114090 RepID=A0ABZ0Q1N9_9LACO|nr:distal tail protein Dit [Pediococcus inopinatus]WPC20857.1 phage tail family protein [Pediococcus inopinatus]